MALGVRLHTIKVLSPNDFEPAFWSLSEGLRHVSSGPTWGPSPDGPTLLRIDHILTTPDLAPTDGVVDCDASGSDHCLLETVISLPPADSLPSPQGRGDPPLLVVADAA